MGSQQFLVNSAQLLQEVFADPSKLGDVVAQMQDNLDLVSQTLTLVGAPEDLRNDVIQQTMDNVNGPNDHQFIYGTLFNFIPADKPLLEVANEFLGSPMSGVLIGALGPALAPWVALGNSISDGDSFSEILANMVGAYFNGATLNLDAAIPLVVNSGLLVLPPATTVNHLSLALGGLFSTGEVANGPWEIYDSAGNTLFSVPSVGGSMFNSLGLDLDSGPLHITATAHPIGPLGAWQGLSEILGLQLGSNWGGKIPGSGFPGADYPAYPPGVGLPPPTIPDLPTSDDVADAGAAAAGLDFGDLINEFFSDVF